MSKILPWSLFFIVLLVFGYFIYYPQKLLREDKEAINTSLILKIEQLGRLELVKYDLRDVLEFEQTNQLMPNEKILLLVAGEAVGCIDLMKIQSTDIQHSNDSIFITLPFPELCYVKLHHEKCKVYDVSVTKLFDKTKLVEGAFKDAEKRIENIAYASGILEKSKNNAVLLLQPLFENLTKKKVVLSFLPETNRIELKNK
ncbi:MAG: hypothetical protein OHK0038_16330 [Flammeovirgaceae bacterium]